ncbi:MAG TPA: hypothetical protein VFA44_15865 [Gaiellaceae bacterium]|nr:hypothetical protein [Gaiellaceae bacterium]
MSTRRHDGEETGREGRFEVELARRPAHGPPRVPRIGHHGQWVEWLG